MLTSSRVALGLSAIAIAISACTINSSPTPSSDSSQNPSAQEGSSGGMTSGGSDTSSDHGCAGACAAYGNAKCAQQTLSECLSQCKEAASKCPSEAETVNACVAKTGVHCTSDNLAESDGCDDAFAAVGTCIKNGGDDTSSDIPACTPHPVSVASSCTGDCSKVIHQVTGGSDHIWCSSSCSASTDCDAATGTKDMFFCGPLNLCVARCTTDTDCKAISGATGCADGSCY